MAQSVIGRQYQMAVSQSETYHLTGMKDRVLNLFDVASDTIWNLKAIDTSQIVSVEFRTLNDSNFYHGVNVVECHDSGLFRRFYHETDSSLNFRGGIRNQSVNQHCDLSTNQRYDGKLYGNSCLMPLPTSSIGDHDEFDFQDVYHEVGYPFSFSVFQNYWSGEKVVVAVKVGELVTPFDTLQNCTLIYEIGTLIKDGWSYVQEYKCTYCTWFIDGDRLPIARASQWVEIKPEGEEGLITRSFEIVRTIPDPKPAPEPELKVCTAYPNPFDSHLFLDAGDVEVFDLGGRRVSFELSDGQLMLTGTRPGMYLLKSTCDGLTTVQRIMYAP